MTKTRAWSALMFLLAGVAIVYGQEAFVPGGGTPQPMRVNRGYFETGAAVRFTMEGTTNDAFEMTFLVDPTEDIVYIWPASKPAGGTQLEYAYGGPLSWAAAGSSRANKQIDGTLKPDEALAAIVETPLYRFHYRKDNPKAITTNDFETEYVGPIAEEAPQFMHHQNTILNPVNTFGYTAGAIQALKAQNDALEARLRALESR